MAVAPTAAALHSNDGSGVHSAYAAAAAAAAASNATTTTPNVNYQQLVAAAAAAAASASVTSTSTGAPMAADCSSAAALNNVYSSWLIVVVTI